MKKNISTGIAAAIVIAAIACIFTVVYKNNSAGKVDADTTQDIETFGSEDNRAAVREAVRKSSLIMEMKI